MPKGVPSQLPIAAESDRRRQRIRLSRRYADPLFRERLRQIRMSISSGISLHDIRNNLGLNSVKNDSLWEDLKSSMAMSFSNPANMMLEWMIRQQARYQMGVDLYNTAKKEKDFDGMAKGIMVMTKIDENAIELQKSLGFLRPFSEDEIQLPTSSEDIAVAEAHYQQLVEDKIIRKLELQRSTQLPVTIDVLERSAAGGVTDPVGQTSLAQSSTDGPVSGNHFPQRLPDGSVDLLHHMGSMAVQDQASSEGTDLLASD